MYKNVCKFTCLKKYNACWIPYHAQNVCRIDGI